MAFADTDPSAHDVAIATLTGVAASRRPIGRPGAATRLVAIDGESGSGKTTFAEHLAAHLGGAQTVRMDDLYPGWDGLRAAVPMLVDQVLRPLSEGRPASYRRYDWLRGEFAGPPEQVQPADWIVLEGVGCASRACAPYLSAIVWLTAPPGIRQARALARDGEVFEPHWQRWAAQEAALFATEHTASRADLVLDTAAPADRGTIGPWNPGT